MANPYKKDSTGQLCTGRGVLEVAQIAASSENATAIIYDGTDTGGRELWTLACLANDCRSTPILNIPFEAGLFCSLTGSGALVCLTVR